LARLLNSSFQHTAGYVIAGALDKRIRRENMLAETRHTHRRPVLRPDTRFVVPDPPETWTAEEIEYLLWPDTPDHLPIRSREEGWPQLLGSC
jgi:hypothetical protein